MSASENAALRPMSKYARKLAERQTGVRPPFEFVDGENSFSEMNANPPSTLKTSAFKNMEVEKGTIVNASITSISKGHLFLQAEDGLRLYMGHNILRKSPYEYEVNIGSVLRCRIEPHPQGPRVTKIYLIVPTP